MKALKDYKYVVLIGDGMADMPLSELDGKTPLQHAHTPNMDSLASKSFFGKAQTIPAGFHPGSDVANLSIMGYDPRKYFTGRAPLESASMGIDLAESDVAFRCNFVYIDHDKGIMADYSSGHISTEESALIMKDIQRELNSEEVKFYPGVSYRHLMVCKNCRLDIKTTPPHDITGKPYEKYLPEDELLKSLFKKSYDILLKHPVNEKRLKEGKVPATNIWLWGQGKKPNLPSYKEKYGITGALISAVDLTKGLGVYAGFTILKVPAVTGWIDTNYVGKAEYAIAALKEKDFVYVHVEAPDEAGHTGNLKYKLQAIEDFDKLVVGNVIRGLEANYKKFRLLLMPDHATPLSLKTHTSTPVPFLIYDSMSPQKNPITYDETLMTLPKAMHFEEGYKLMDYFIAGEKY